MSKTDSHTKINHYDGFEVIDTFQIRRNAACEHLAEWLNTKGELKESERDILERIRQEINRYGRSWNEEELKINFISFVFYVAAMNVPDKIHTFFERRLSGSVENVQISVIVDGMLATPTLSGLPQTPYFFLQEYKRSLGDDHDPEGQMLAAMILAQALNQDNEYLYGCWIQGRIWQFTTLKGKEYCVSQAYDASQKEDLEQIIFILRSLKDILISRITST